MKPKIKFLNYIHEPVFFKPVEWCITEECARFFWPRDSRMGRLLLQKNYKIWGWKEHSKTMQIYLGCVVLDEYKFQYVEEVLSGNNTLLVCLHFQKRLVLQHPPMPEFKQDPASLDDPF